MQFMFECMMRNFSKLYILNGNKSDLIIITDKNDFCLGGCYFVCNSDFCNADPFH